MIKAVICITASVMFLIINTFTLFLKPEFIYAQNDEENYCVSYQKWIGTVVFMSTIIISLFCIYFAINLSFFISFSLLTIECLLVLIYNLVKYKGITVNGENIKVERLFRDELNTKFSSISSVLYVPNAKLSIKLKNRKTFDVSFNSDNFHTFYMSLINNKVKFKTSYIPGEERHVYLVKYDMTLRFPKTMFREYYQNKRFFRNSQYLFSARSLENNEYIECYFKESGKNYEEFVELVKNDLKINNFKVKDDYEKNIDGFDFVILTAKDMLDENMVRSAYIHKTNKGFLVIYADCTKDDETNFHKKMEDVIRKPAYEDGKSQFSRV